MSYSTEIIRRVFDDNNGAFIEVAPDMEINAVMLRTINVKGSQDYWGTFDVTLPREFAARLGQALIDASKEVGD